MISLRILPCVKQDCSCAENIWVCMPAPVCVHLPPVRPQLTVCQARTAFAAPTLLLRYPLTEPGSRLRLPVTSAVKSLL